MKSSCTSEKTQKKRSIELPVLNSTNSPSVDAVAEKKGGVAHSRTAIWRAVSLIALHILMAIHIIQWRLMGETVTPIEPSEAMHTIQRGAVNAGFIFFLLAILATLVLGRFVCGWACHVVALQDLCAWMMKKIGITPRPFRSRLLIFVPLLVALYMFVWPTVYWAFIKQPQEPLFPQFTSHLITTNFWETFPPVWVAIPFLFICGFMTVYFLGSKGFCTYACPYGGFFGIADQVAPGKIRVTDACNECGHCTATCTSNVIVHKEVKEYGMVVDPGCMKCMDCISVCPNDALYFGFGKPALAVKKTVKKNYSVTWAEDIFGAVVFFASFLAVWDVYQLVPMLMALGVALVTTFLSLRVVRLFTSKSLSFYQFNLKSEGSIKLAGWVFLLLAGMWIALNAHSGFIHYHESRGKVAYEAIRIPDELALARPNPARWLSATDNEAIKTGKSHLSTATNYGLLANTTALPRLAWMEYLSGNTEQAVNILGKAAANQHGEGKALSLYYRGVMMNRLGRHQEALPSLDGALAERGDMAVAREERGEALWLLNRREEAVAAWNEAARQNPRLPLAQLMLAGAAAASGDTAGATAFETRAASITPNDPLFYWMLGLRLQNVGMTDLAEKHFQRAIQLNPEFRRAR